MTDMVCTTLQKIFNLPTLPALGTEGSIKFFSQDCGFEVGEDEIVSGMLIDSPGCLTIRSIPEVGPEEFESIYGYFLS